MDPANEPRTTGDLKSLNLNIMPRRFLPAWRRQGSDRTDSLSLDLPPADLTDGNLQIRPEELERRKFCGRGGNATVYYLDHKKLGKIALKQVLEYGSADAIERNRLVSQLQLRQLNRPAMISRTRFDNIPPI